MNPAIEDLIRVLAQLCGNKVYMRDLEVILKSRLQDPTPHEADTVYRLIRDLKSKL